MNPFGIKLRMAFPIAATGAAEGRWDIVFPVMGPSEFAWISDILRGCDL